MLVFKLHFSPGKVAVTDGLHMPDFFSVGVHTFTEMQGGRILTLKKKTKICESVETWRLVDFIKDEKAGQD